MRVKIGSVIIAATLLLAFTTSAAAANPRVTMETSRGAIVVELYPDNAPLTVANFLRYIDEDRFSTARFYRVVTLANQPRNDVKIEVIQGGLGFEPDMKSLAEIEHETTDKTGLRHKAGTLSMARTEPGTASSEFFICVTDQPELDFGGRRNPDRQGFAAFGKVVEGMDVVRKIQGGAESGQMLLEPVAVRIGRLVKTP